MDYLRENLSKRDGEVKGKRYGQMKYYLAKIQHYIQHHIQHHIRKFKKLVY